MSRSRARFNCLALSHGGGRMTRRREDRERERVAREEFAAAAGRAFEAMREAENALLSLHALGRTDAARQALRLYELRFDFHAFRNEVGYGR